jgi:hypothetical protein
LGRKHIDTLSIVNAPLPEERVEERRPDAREAKRPGASDVIKRREVPLTHGVTSKRKITRADVVKGPTTITTNEMKGKGKTVLRLLSRNNPV